MSYVRIVDVIPNELSGLTYGHWNPQFAVNPGNAGEVVIVSEEVKDSTVVRAVAYSYDYGEDWQMAYFGAYVLDQSAGFGVGGAFYDAVASNSAAGPVVSTMRTSDPATPSSVGIDPRSLVDQPYLNVNPANVDRIFLGYNDHSHLPNSASVDVGPWLAAPFPPPVRLDPRNPSPCDGYEIRPAMHSNGTVYVAYKSWLSWDQETVTSAIVVARDDQWGSNGFGDLKDTDNLAGVRVATNVVIFDPQYLGGQRLDNDLAIAVDPNNSSTVYLAWGDNSTAGQVYRLRVRRSLESGSQSSWSDDLLTVDNANLAGLAINDGGTVGFLYQQLVAGPPDVWETHLRRTTDVSGKNWDDLILARTPTVSAQMADYARITSVGNGFYGAFPALNIPDPANFPNGVKFLRSTSGAPNRTISYDPSLIPVFKTL
jgi:hypothetical protein